MFSNKTLTYKTLFLFLKSFTIITPCSDEKNHLVKQSVLITKTNKVQASAAAATYKTRPTHILDMGSGEAKGDGQDRYNSAPDAQQGVTVRLQDMLFGGIVTN